MNARLARQLWEQLDSMRAITPELGRAVVQIEIDEDTWYNNLNQRLVCHSIERRGMDVVIVAVWEEVP